MSKLLERFRRYVKIETTACEDTDAYPSSPGQLELGRLLAAELRELGLPEVIQDEHGIVTATVPATVQAAPTIVFMAHVDTSPEFTAHQVNPLVHAPYDGGDIALPKDGRVIRAAENPHLVALRGKTIITSDGSTLLGADDKAGVAVIMDAAERLMADRTIPHGPVRVCFTCDEEIGRGVLHVDPEKLDAVVAYTLDGEGHGTIDNETFSADLAVVTVRGRNTHPGYAEDCMVNALKVAADFLQRLPADRLCPERTGGRDGFVHPYVFEGGVPQAKIRVLLRDFDTAKLREQQALLEATAREAAAAHPGSAIEVVVQPQYRNMAEGLVGEPRAVALAVEAMRAVGLEPELARVRGGTDGSGLTAKGLPTPNLATGMHNYHSPLEWACLEEMEMARDVVIELVRRWGAQKRYAL